MDERQWLASVDPQAMMEALLAVRPMPGCVRLGKASERKCRLFAVAWSRSRPEARGREPSRIAAWDAAERFVDGQADGWELAQQRRETAGSAGWICCWSGACAAALHAARHCQHDAPGMAELVRDIFGNPYKPYRPPGPSYSDNGTVWTLGPAHPWLAWNDGAALRIAQAIYNERTWSDLPILADALEEAGCDHQRILSHCRQGGLHARGCWVVDLILGKN